MEEEVFPEPPNSSRGSQGPHFADSKEDPKSWVKNVLPGGGGAYPQPQARLVLMETGAQSSPQPMSLCAPPPQASPAAVHSLPPSLLVPKEVDSTLSEAQLL